MRIYEFLNSLFTLSFPRRRESRFMRLTLDSRLRGNDNEIADGFYSIFYFFSA
jgi:hypothetical protein